MTVPAARDRAAAVARAVIEIVVQHIRGDGGALHQQLADYLRDEIADERRQTLNEIRREDG